uniref:Uncharacterized protein n=1 Tax=Populus trichocarpa TaxID=3694 RepID=A0A3N7ELJ6_POPTR|eukprot:XP_024453655.1 uncharacterized protein LOC7478142 [Populus trichocarpa]
MKMPPSVSSVVSSIPSSQSRAQGRIVAMSGQMTYQGAPQHNQINRTSPTPPLHSLQRIPAQNRSQPPAQQEVQCPGSDSQASSPPKIQGNRRGSFLYGGTQVMGATRNVGVGHGDQSFPGTTFFLASHAIWWSASWWSWSSCGCNGVSRICCSSEMTWYAQNGCQIFCFTSDLAWSRDVLSLFL